MPIEQPTPEEIEAARVAQLAADIAEIKSAGYSENATKEDWLLLMNNDTDTFGSEAEQNRVATIYEGNINEFITWFKRYK